MKVAAAGLNPIDWKLRSGDYKALMPIQFPFVPGVGVSEQVVVGTRGHTVQSRTLSIARRTKGSLRRAGLGPDGLRYLRPF